MTTSNKTQSWLYGHTFVQLPLSIFLDTRLNPMDLKVYAILASHVNKSGICTPSAERVRQLAGLANKTYCSKIIRKLASFGYIQLKKRSHLTNLTRLCVPQLPEEFKATYIPNLDDDSDLEFEVETE